MSDTSTWLIDLFEEQGPTMHRLAMMLGAESESGHILRTSLLGLAKRSNRIVDPSARVEYLAEHVVPALGFFCCSKSNRRFPETIT